jgi:Bacterial PH domain
MRLVCAAAAAVVVVAMIVVGALLKSSSTGVVSFHTADQVAMICLGLIIGAGILALGRPRVDADAEGIRVRNILGSHRLGWELVRSVRFDRSSAWASLLLTTGEELAVLAVQAADKEYAVSAVEGLRALLAASRPAADPGPPLLYDD